MTPNRRPKVIDQPQHALSREAQNAGSERRSYQRPRIIHRESLEAMAADCSFPGGKGDPTCTVGFS